MAVGIKYDKSQSLKKINFSNTNPSMDHKGRDKISHKGGKLIEEAVTKHTQIIEMKLRIYIYIYIYALRGPEHSPVTDRDHREHTGGEEGKNGPQGRAQ